MPLIFPGTFYDDEVFRLRADTFGQVRLLDKQTGRLLKLKGPASHFLAKLLDIARARYGIGFVDAQRFRGVMYDYCNEMAGHPVRSATFLSSIDPAKFFTRAYHGD